MKQGVRYAVGVFGIAFGDQPFPENPSHSYGLWGRRAITPNVLAVETIPPNLVGARVNGTTLVLRYDEPLDESSVPDKGQFEVETQLQGLPQKQPWVSQTPTAVAIEGRFVTLTLGTAAVRSQTVRMTYTRPASNRIRDLVHNDAAAFSAWNVLNVTGDTTAPSVDSASVNARALTVDFDETLDRFSVPDPSAFTVTVTVDGAEQAQTPTAVAIGGARNGVLTLTLATRVGHGQPATVSYAAPDTGAALQDRAENRVASFVETVTNVTPPAPSAATVDGTALVLAFDGVLDGAALPAPGDFTVTSAGAARPVVADGVAVAVSEVRLTLDFAVAAGHVVAVGYAPGETPLRGADATVVAPFAGLRANNVTVATPPALQRAAVNATALTLTFSETLNGTSRPPPGAFTVTVDGSARTPTAVAVAGAELTLTLAPKVRSGEAVTVDYARPASGPVLRDRPGEPAESFTGETVENLTAPAFERAATSADGAAVVVTFDAALDAGSEPVPGAFTVTVDGSARTPTDVAVDARAVTLDLATAVTLGEVVTVSYAKPGTGAVLRDAAGNAVETFTDRAVVNRTDVTAPAFERAEVSAAALTVIFDEALDGASAPAGSAFAVTATPAGGGSARTIAGTGAAVAIAGRTVTLTLDAAVAHGETVTLGYTDPGAGAGRLRDASENAVATFSGEAVTNATPHPNAPVVATGGVALSSHAGSDGIYARGESIRVRLTFDQAVHVTGAPRLKIALAPGAGAAPGAQERWAAYAGGSGTSALVFAYEVAASDHSAAGVAVRADTLALDGGSIRSVAEDAHALLGHGGLGHDPAHRVDGSLTQVPAPAQATALGTAVRIAFSARLDDASVPAAGAFTVTVAGTARTPSGVAVEGRTVELTLSSAVAAGQTVTASYARPATGATLRAADGAHEAQSFTNTAVRNETVAGGPVFSLAAVDGAVVEVRLSAAVVAGTLPQASAFSARVDGVSRGFLAGSVSSVANGDVRLRLASPVRPGQTVRLSYDRAGAGSGAHGPLQDASGREVASFVDEAVTNYTPPALASATVNGAALTLTFDGALDPASVPAPGKFAVFVNNAPRPVAAGGVAVEGREVRLTLGLAVALSDTVLVEWIGGGNALRGVDGSPVATFQNHAVDNVTVPTPPEVTRLRIQHTFGYFEVDERLDVGSLPGADAFTATVDGVAQTPIVVRFIADGSGVTFELGEAPRSGQSVTLGYEKPATGAVLRDLSGEAMESFAGEPVTNLTPPAVDLVHPATVNATSLTARFDAALDEDSVPDESAFTVRANGAAQTPSAVAIDGRTVTLTLSPGVTHGQHVTLDYILPPAGAARLGDPAGNEVFQSHNQPVINRTPPVVARAAVDAGTLTLVFDGALDAASAPAGGAFTVRATPEGGTARAIAGTGTAAIEGATVRVTLASAVAYAEAVTAAYAPPEAADADRLRDTSAAPLEVAAFAGAAVTNATPHPDAPRIEGVALSSDPGPDATYIAGDTVRVRLTFDRAVHVTGTPRLNLGLEPGGRFTVRPAAYASGSGTTALVFAYEVGLSDRTPVGLAVRADSLELAGGAIRSVAKNAHAVLAHDGLAADPAHRVHGLLTAVPALSGAQGDAAALVLTFSAYLDPASEPDASAFTVEVAGTDRTPGAVAVAGRTVTLTLAPALAHGQDVKVSYTHPGAAMRPLRALDGGAEAAGFTDEAVTNATPHPDAPRFERATVSGDRLTLHFTGALQRRKPAAYAAFTVEVDGAPAALGPGAIATVEGATATLALVAAVNADRTVTVGYDKGNAGQSCAYAYGPCPLQDAAGREVPSFPAAAAANLTPAAPTGPPAVSGAVLTLGFDATLDPDSVPGAGAFTVSAGGAHRTPTRVSLDGATLTLTLGAAVAHGQAVTLRYVPPVSTGAGHGPLRTGGGVEVAGFTAAVVNATPDVTAPAFERAAASADGRAVVVTFDEALDDAATPVPGAFTVTAGGTPQAPSAVSIDGAAVTLALSAAVAHGPAVTVSYARPASAGDPRLADAAGNAVASFAGETVSTDATAPRFASATVHGTQLSVTFDEALDPGRTPAGGVFTVTATPPGGGAARTIAGTSAAVSITGATAGATLASAVVDGETVTLAYEKPATHALRDTDATPNEVAAFSGAAVTNAIRAPRLASATVDGTALSVTFDEALDAGAAPAGRAFTVTATAPGGGAARTIAGTSAPVALAGATAGVALVSAVADGETVTLAYARPGTNALRDTGAPPDETASFSGATVINATRGPRFERATVDGTELSVTFDEALDAGAAPAGSAFTVTATPPDGAARTIAGTGAAVTIDGATAGVALASAVAEGETVTLAYVKPGTSPLRDTDVPPDAAAGFSGAAVANATDTTAPAFRGAALYDDTRLVIAFDEALAPAPRLLNSNFLVQLNPPGEALRTLDLTGAPTIAGNTVTLTLTHGVAPADGLVRVSYLFSAGASDRYKLTDAAGNDVARFNYKSVSTSPDTAAPAFDGARAQGRSLEMTFDEPLDPASAPAGDAFTVTATRGGVSTTLPGTGAAVSIAGAVVRVVLAGALRPADTAVTVGYAKPAANALRDTATIHNEVAGFTGEPVSNATPASVAGPPAVNGRVLAIAFDAPLDAASAPAGSAFTVTAGGADRTPAGVSLDAATVTLTLAAPVANGQAVTVRYVHPGAGHRPLRTGAGAEVADFAQAVRNDTPPVVSAATTSTDGTRVAVTFDAALDAASVPARGAFTVSAGGAAQIPDAVSLDGAVVTLALATAVARGQTVTVGYVHPGAGYGALRDGAGHEVAGFTGVAVANAVAPPAVARAATSTDGTRIEVTFDRALDAASKPAPAAFTVTEGATARTPGAVAIDGATVTLTLARALAEGAAVTLDYATPASHGLRGVAGHAVADFTEAVDNRTDFTAPAFERAATSADGTAVAVTFDEALDDTSTPAAEAFTVTVHAAGEEAAARTPTGVAIADATVTLALSPAVVHGETVTVSYARPDSGARLRDLAGHPAASFAAQAVENATPHPDAPVVRPVAEGGVAVASDAGPDGTYLLGETVRVRLTFDQAVYVTGTPRLRLGLAPDGDADTGERWAAYAGGSGTAALEFLYQVAAADRAPDGVAVLADTLALDGGTIRSVSNHAGAVLAHAGLAPDPAHRVDPTLTAVPAPLQATAAGGAVHIVFSAWLDPASVPDKAAFTVTVAGAALTPAAVSVDARTLTLTLATAVARGQAVTVGYAKPVSGAVLRALDGGAEAAGFAGLTAPIGGPKLESATVEWTALALTFDASLDAASAPAPGAFAVAADGTAQIPTAVSVEGRTVALTLPDLVLPGQSVTVGYTHPGAGMRPLRAAAGGHEAASFAAHAVDNATPDAPRFDGATVSEAALSIAFTHTLGAPVPDPGAFAVTVAGSARGVAAVSIDGAVVTLTLSRAVDPGEAVTVSYDPASAGSGAGAGPLEGVHGHRVPGFAAQAAANRTDRTVPVVVPAETVTTDGRTVDVAFSEPLAAGADHTPALGAFTVTVDGVAQTPAAATVTGRVLRLTLATAVARAAGFVRVRYAPPATGEPRLADPAGNAVAGFDIAVRDTRDSLALSLRSATVSGATLVLLYNERLWTDPPLAGAFTVTVAGDVQTPTGVAIGGGPVGNLVTLTLATPVSAGDAVTVSYDKTMARSGGEGTAIQDHGGNEMRSFAGRSARNKTATPAAPALASARVNGAQLTGSFDQPVTGECASFTVTVDGAERERHFSNCGYVTDDAYRDFEIRLTQAVTWGQEVKLAYVEHAGLHRLGDGLGNAVESFTETVTNETPPALAGARVNAAALTLAFDVALDEDAVPAPGAFTVTAQAPGAEPAAATVSAVEVEGATVTLTLGPAAAHGETVTVAYARPETGARLGDAAGLALVESFAAQAVENATPHPDAPVVPAEGGVAVSSDAGADGVYLLGETVRVRLVFDRAVHVAGTPRLKLALAPDGEADTGERWAAYDGGSGTAALGFAYRVASADRAPDGVAVLADTLELDGGAIRSVAKNVDAVLAHAGLGPDPAHRVDPTLTAVPAPSQAAVAGTVLGIVFSAFLDEDSAPVPGAFTVTMGGTAHTPGEVSVEGRTVALTLATAAVRGQTVTVGYQKPATGAVLRALDGGAEAAGFAGFTAAIGGPALEGATVHGSVLTLTFDTALDETSAPGADAFAFTVAGTPHAQTPGAVSVEGSTVTLTLPGAGVIYGQRVTVDYTHPGAGMRPLRAAAGGHEAASFAGEQAVNTVPDPDGPRFERAEIDTITRLGTRDLFILTLHFDGKRVDGSGVAGLVFDAFTVTVDGTSTTAVEARVGKTYVTLHIYEFPLARGQRLTVSYDRTAAGARALRDASGREVPSFTDRPVPNPPVFASATVVGETLTLAFSGSPDPASVPAPGDFAVTVEDDARAVAAGGVAIAGREVRLTLVSAVRRNDTVTVGYTAGETPLRGAGGGAVANLAARGATNGTRHAAPVPTGATVDGATLVLAFDQYMAQHDRPNERAMLTVRVDGAAQTPTASAVDGQRLTLTLGAPVRSGERVTLSYVRHRLAGGLRSDQSGNYVADFADMEVANRTRPAFAGATVDGATLAVAFDGPLDEGSVPDGSAFTVTAGGAAQHPAALDIEGATVTLTLAPAATHGQAVTVSYIHPGADNRPVRDLAGHEALDFTGETVTNRTAPVPTGATVAGAALALAFDGALDAASVPDGSAFTVAGTAAATSVTAAVVAADDATQLALTLDPAVGFAESGITVGYAAPGAGARLRDGAGNAVADFAGQAVVNETVNADAPVFAGATVAGATLAVTFSEALDGAHLPAPGVWTVGVDGAPAPAPTGARLSADGRTVTLTLAAAVTAGRTVILGYEGAAAPGALRDAASHRVANFSGRAVENGTAPFAGATVSAARLVIDFGHALAAAPALAKGAFTVTVTEGGAAEVRTPTAVSVAGDKVTLALATPVGHGAAVAVTVGYDPGQSAERLRYAGGAEVAGFEAQAVENETLGLARATVVGETLALAFSAALDAGATPAAGAFPVAVGGGARTVAAVAVAGREVRLTLASAVVGTDAVTVGYVHPGAGNAPVRDGAGNEAASFAGHEVENLTGTRAALTGLAFAQSPPRDTDRDGAGDTWAAGDAIAVEATFDRAVEVDVTGGRPALALEVGGRTVQAAYASGSGTATLVFSWTVEAGDADADGVSVPAHPIALEGGAIGDAAGAAVLAHDAGLAADAARRVDAVAPVRAEPFDPPRFFDDRFIGIVVRPEGVTATAGAGDVVQFEGKRLK